MNAGDVEATNSGGAGNAGRHNFEVIEADEALVGHVNGKPVRSEKVGTKNGFRDIFHMKCLSEGGVLRSRRGTLRLPHVLINVPLAVTRYADKAHASCLQLKQGTQIPPLHNP